MAGTNATYTDAINTESPVYRPRKFTPLTKQRFQRDRRRRLLDHLRGVATYPQHLLISRIIDLDWEITRRMAQPDRSEHASRELMAQHNHLRLMLRELGLGAREAQRAPTIGELAAAFDANQARRRQRRPAKAAT